MLGTDVPAPEAVRGVRWEKGLLSMVDPQTLLQWRNIVEARKAVLGREHHFTLWAMICWAWTELSYGNSRKAIAIFQEAFEMKFKGAHDVKTVLLWNAIAWSYLDAGNHEIAITLFEETQKIQELTLGQNHPDTTSTIRAKARTKTLQRKIEEAIKLLAPILSQQREALGNEHLETIETASLLAGAYQGHRNTWTRSTELFEAVCSARLQTLMGLCSLAWTHTRLQQTKEAVRILRKLIAIQSSNLGQEDPITAICIKRLSDVLETGTIPWKNRLAKQRKKIGGNLFGNAGMLKCSECRRIKRKVAKMSPIYSAYTTRKILRATTVEGRTGLADLNRRRTEGEL